MKVLVVTHRDGPNLFIENIVKTIVERGHTVGIYANYTDNQSTRMFKKFGIKIHPIKKLRNATVESYDCILCPSQAVNSIAFRKKYIFSFCNMNPHFDHVRGSDFVFTLGDLDEDYNSVFATMPVGNPKNDIAENVSPAESTNQILVIDTGHFPFSKAGKYQAARMILDMADELPDKNIVVKPRWMPGVDVSSMTHVNKYHIYDIIEELTNKKLPSNLTLLRKHLNLQELIDKSESVVTLCTTAFLDVALRGKPLIVASGFDNEDTFHLRADYFDRVYDYARESGCVVDYKDILDYLPQGIDCNKEFLDKAFYSKEGASDRVVDVIEYVTENFLKHGKMPKVRTYDYCSYQDEIKKNNMDIDLGYLIANRMYSMSESVVALNNSISVHIDWSGFINKQKQLCNVATPTKKGYDLLVNNVKSEKVNYILDHKGDLCSNCVDLSYYYEMLFDSQRYDELLTCFEKDTFHPALNFYVAKYYSQNGEYDKSNECLERYFDDYITREFVKYKCDTLSSFWSANQMMCDNYKKQGKYVSGFLKMYSCINKSVKKIDIFKYAKKMVFKKIKIIYRKIKKKVRALKNRLRCFYIIIKSKLGWLNERQKQVQIFKDKYKGKKAFIIGNGPSLRAEDLERIKEKGYICFGANKIYKMFEQSEWRPDVYACFDSLVYTQNREEIFDNIGCDIFLNSSFGLNNCIKDNIYMIDYLFFKNIIYFSKDARYIYSGGTVTYVLISLAYMMGIREMYVIGCDHNYSVFEKQKKGSEIEVNNKVNHDYFSKDYMKKGEKMNVGDLKRAEKGYQIAKRYIERHGGHIYNATRGGRLEVFERVDLDELLAEGEE